MADREFDIIVYGATGYTGRLVAEHFLREYGSTVDGPKWAMAGRSLSKLEAVRDEIGHDRLQRPRQDEARLRVAAVGVVP